MSLLNTASALSALNNISVINDVSLHGKITGAFLRNGGDYEAAVAEVVKEALYQHKRAAEVKAERSRRAQLSR